jgi:hypothetical protein
MQSTLSIRLTATLAKCVLIAVVAGASMTALSQTAGIEPEAQRLLKASTDFLARQNKFSLDTRNSLEVVLHSGQKIEFNHTARQSVQRPDKLRAERKGDLVHQLFIYDGRSLTLFNPADKAYATASVPGTLEGMLDYARESLDIVAPAGDLLYKDAYAILMDGVTSGIVVGKSVIEGVRCDQLAFRGPNTDWQIWIQEGPQPLPRKMVITTRDVTNSPQFSVTVTKWDLQPRFDDQTFRFAAPGGAKKIDFLTR